MHPILLQASIQLISNSTVHWAKVLNTVTLNSAWAWSFPVWDSAMICFFILFRSIWISFCISALSNSSSVSLEHFAFSRCRIRVLDIPTSIYLLKVNNRKHWNKVWNMFKVYNKDTRTTPPLPLSLMLILNIFHTLF